MISRIRKFEISGKKLLFVGIIKGLVSERDLLRTLVDEFEPELLLIGISPEELKGMREYLKKPFEIHPDDYEVIYALKLKKFGEVGIPVPAYLEAFAISRKSDIEMIPLDIPEEEYSDLYLRKVEFYHIFLANRRKKKLAKKDFEAKSPEEFVLLWDREVNKITPFKEIEEEREKYMGKKIKEILQTREEKRLLVILELERLQGVLSNLNLLHIT